MDTYLKRESAGVFVYPPFEIWDLLENTSEMNLEETTNLRKQSALYIHIPFCDSFCTFCSFYRSRTLKNDEETVERYISILLKELSMYAETDYVKSLEFGAVYLGGGTPSCLSSSQLSRILKYCSENFNFGKDIQVTVEGNASNLDKDKLKIMLENGCNRISLGVQTFDENTGKILNLPHSNSQVFQTIKSARELGHKNISIDLIYNLPGQTLKIWKNDLETSISSGIEHMSIFCLQIYPKTMLVKQLDNNEVPQIGSQDEAIEKYEMAIKMLISAGYIQESLTDFVKPGIEGYKYGRLRAESSEVLAIGVGSNGYLNRCVYRNHKSIKDYIEMVESNKYLVATVRRIPATEEMHGFIAKGLRHLTVRKQEFRKRFDKEIEDVFEFILSELKQRGLLKIDDNKIELTDSGKVWGGNVCREFYSQQVKSLLAKAGERIC